MSSLKLSQRLDQRMVLTPQLRQRIEMLQMNSLELTDLIQQEIVSNPILEEVGNDEEVQEISEKILDQNSEGFDVFNNDFETNSNGSLNGDNEFDSTNFESAVDYGLNEEYSTNNDFESDNSEFNEAKVDAFEEIDFGREFRDYLDPGYKTQEIEFKEDAPSFEQFLTRSASLTEHLEWQLNLSQISEKQEEIGIEIIGNLDDDGRLTVSVEEIAQLTESTLESVEVVRQIVMQLEPVGCGARNVQECLAIQLEVIGEGESIAANLVKNHFTDLPQTVGNTCRN